MCYTLKQFFSKITLEIRITALKIPELKTAWLEMIGLAEGELRARDI